MKRGHRLSMFVTRRPAALIPSDIPMGSAAHDTRQNYKPHVNLSQQKHKELCCLLILSIKCMFSKVIFINVCYQAVNILHACKFRYLTEHHLILIMNYYSLLIIVEYYQTVLHKISTFKVVSRSFSYRTQENHQNQKLWDVFCWLAVRRI